MEAHGDRSSDAPACPWRWRVGLLAGLAVAVRLVALARYGGHPMRGGDQEIHLHDGAVLADVHVMVFPNAPFGIQAYVGAATVLARLLGLEVWVVVGVANALLGGATVALVATIGRRLATAGAGLTAAGVVALMPELVVGSVPIMSEPLFTVLMLGCLLVALAEGGSRQAVALGLIVGVAAAVRPVGLPLLALAIVGRPGWRDRGRALALAGAGALVVLVPLAVRASLAADAVVVSDLRVGTNWCIGRLADGDGGGRPAADCDVGPQPSAQATSAARMAEGWRLLRANPEREPRLVVGRLRASLDPGRDGTVHEVNGDQQISAGEVDAMAAAIRWSTWVLLVGGVAGTCWSLWRRHRARAVAAAAGLLLVAPAATVGDPRYRLPLLPLLAILAVVPAFAALASPPAQTERR